ncbi:MAG: hypothetical protein ACI85S_002535, partial [Pseudohongiellaceae bacterium]
KLFFCTGEAAILAKKSRTNNTSSHISKKG